MKLHRYVLIGASITVLATQTTSASDKFNEPIFKTASHHTREIPEFKCFLSELEKKAKTHITEGMMRDLEGHWNNESAQQILWDIVREIIPTFNTPEFYYDTLVQKKDSHLNILPSLTNLMIHVDDHYAKEKKYLMTELFQKDTYEKLEDAFLQSYNTHILKKTASSHILNKTTQPLSDWQKLSGCFDGFLEGYDLSQVKTVAKGEAARFEAVKVVMEAFQKTLKDKTLQDQLKLSSGALERRLEGKFPSLETKSDFQRLKETYYGFMRNRPSDTYEDKVSSLMTFESFLDVHKELGLCCQFQISEQYLWEALQKDKKENPGLYNATFDQDLDLVHKLAAEEEKEKRAITTAQQQAEDAQREEELMRNHLLALELQNQWNGQ